MDLKKKKIKVYFLHGIENGLFGSRKNSTGRYLSEKFDFSGLDMSLSKFKQSKDVNFPKYLARELFSSNFFKAFSVHHILTTMMKTCVEKQVENIKKILQNKEFETQFDLFVAASWGGAVFCEILNSQDLIKYDQKILFIAPAIYSINPKFIISDNLKKYFNVKILHGNRDKTIPYKHSVKLCNELKWDLITVEDGHKIKNTCIGEEKGSLFQIITEFCRKKESQES